MLLCLALLAVLGTAVLALLLSRKPRQQEYVISQACEEYRPLVEKVAAVYGVPDYVDLIMAVMMQESSGTVKDVMQASECQYNTEYPRKPNGITDPEYSIACGVQELKHALELAGSTGPQDMDKIELALQAYNFGSDSFIAYVKEHGHEQWSQEAAKAFAQMASGGEKRSESMAVDLGPWNYGDQFYPEHVLRYYKPDSASQTDPKDEN